MTNPRLNKEIVALAYRLYFGRDPEGPEVVDEKLRVCQTTEQLGRLLASSQEFRERNVCWAPTDWPPIQIDVEIGETMLAQMFLQTAKAWTELGRDEPYWSVLSAENYRRGRFEEHSEGFWDSGRRDLAVFEAFLARNGIALSGEGVCLELGSGVGRVTRWLSPKFKTVLAYDISSAHLALAEQHLQAGGIANVVLHHLRDEREFDRFPEIDAFFSVIVLQHNPPPVIKRLIGVALGRLRSGGIAYFQVPTYARGYSFDADAYLRSGRRKGIEMHVLPQGHIFDLMSRFGCSLLEVREDGWVGMPGWISNTFLIQKGRQPA